MTTVLIIICAVFAAAVIVAIVLHLGWSVFTQDRDHGVIATGPVMRRRIWGRRARPHAGPINPEAIPGATTDETTAPVAGPAGPSPQQVRDRR